LESRQVCGAPIGDPLESLMVFVVLLLETYWTNWTYWKV
jgi:hypothetical protein